MSQNDQRTHYETPLRTAWLTVTTSTGPGMSAPERPTRNELIKICGRFSITNLWMSKT